MADWEAALLEAVPPALVAFVGDLKLPASYAIALDALKSYFPRPGHLQG